MPFTTTIHEPSPTYPTTLAYGRGGAGNRTTRSLPPNTIKAPTTTTAHSTNFSTGRGGMGNMHHTSEDRRMFSFDEELAKQGKVTASPVYHIGRGGQGNAVNERRRESDASSSASSKGSKSSLDWVRGVVRGAKS